MPFRIKDPIFNHLGKPGVVKEYDEKSGNLIVDNKGSHVVNEFRHGYISGIPPEIRQKFNSFMDDVGKEESPEAKVTLLQSKISEMEQVTEPGVQVLVGYLKSELSHLMHSSHYSPRYYGVSSRGVG